MRYGVLILPERSWAAAVATWRLAEQLGFDHAWTYDHLTWRSLRDRPWYAAIPTLTAAACATTRIRLGTLVASPNFREPSPFAKELMTLDDISEGRLTLGFGAGADGFDATATRNVTWSPLERQQRFAEFVAALDGILSHPEWDFSGTHYTVNGARTIPACRQAPRIPFALAATGPRSMRVVAEHADTWVAVDGRGAGARELQLLQQACDEAGRDVTTLDRLVLLGHATHPLSSADEFFRLRDHFASLGFTDLVVHWPRSEPPFRADQRILERIASALASAGR